MASDPLLAALTFQAEGCAAFGSAFYADLLRSAAADAGPHLRSLFAPWESRDARELIQEAVALRFLGGLHDLVLDGADQELAAVFPPRQADANKVWSAARSAIERHESRMRGFMAHEPQTNEVRRSACLLPGFLTVAAETGLPLRCVELGASAGLNQLWSRFGYRLGAGHVWGDPASPVRLETEWRGEPPPDLRLRPRVVETAACDRAPLDLGDPAQRRRLQAYIWPDQPERLERLAAAIEMALSAGVTVERADALDFAAKQGAPRPGVATVIYHSIFWQYLPQASAEALREVIEAHGARASEHHPLAWLRMEPADAAHMELRLSSWPGGRDERLAHVHAHGAWIEWTRPPPRP